jgi:alpha/beta superfamily hydrolase
VSGDRDQFATPAELKTLIGSLPEPKKLVLIASADHFFEGRLREMRDAVEQWIGEAVNL